MKIFKPIPTEDFFVISHEHKDRFFVVIWPKKPLGYIKYWPRIDPFFSKNQNFDPKHTKESMGKIKQISLLSNFKILIF